MAIYTPFWTEVEFLSARRVTVLVERTQDAAVRWHYPEHARVRRSSTSFYEEIQVWHAVARDAKTGKRIVDGQEIPGHEFRADGGWPEILAAMQRVATEQTKA